MIVDGTVEWFETEEELDEHVWDLMCNEAERCGVVAILTKTKKIGLAL